MDGKEMMKQATAFSPGHVTGFFAIADGGQDPLEKGSLGAGFSLSQGVTTRIQKGQGIYINNELRKDARVSQRVLEAFSPYVDTSDLAIHHTIELPEGSGFGTSGAGALSLALALNAYSGNPLTKTQAAQVAHVAEVQCRTGLGTVIGEWKGGMEIRIKPGAPGIGEMTEFRSPRGLKALFALLGPYPTPGMLEDQQIRRRINQYGRDRLQQLRKGDYLDFLSYSREFALNTQLASPRIREIIQEMDLKGITGSMLMFGEAFFTLIPEAESHLGKELLISLAPEAKIIETDIDYQGGRVL